MTPRLALLCVLVLVSSILGSAQTPSTRPQRGLPVAAAEDVGMSSQRLNRIKPAMQGYVDRGEVAGVVTLVARRGKVVHLESV